MSKQSFHERMNNLPTFDQLAELPGVPKGATWGLWDKDGVKDELGTLNLLDPRTITEAAQEIREGISVSLNLPMHKPTIAIFHRQNFEHTIRDNAALGSQSLDDTVLFNTQAGSQWDGLRHVFHEETACLYNGFGKAEVIGPNATPVLGIHKWHAKGCIIGRGVLVDFVAYAKRHNIQYEASKYFAITHEQLDAAASEQGLIFKQGDILLVRSGFLQWYNECPDKATRDGWFTGQAGMESVGVSPAPETIAWVWNHHFSAVAGDSIAWEALPYPTDGPSFHQYLLPSWGTPIGELWDLEELASCCQRFNRWSFFLTSVPMNVPGGVASPPNAVAIF